MEQEFYSIKELAVVFGVHSSTIRRAIKLGFLVAIRIGIGPRSPYRISRRTIDSIHEATIRALTMKTQKR